jgi:hypothetical protein
MESHELDYDLPPELIAQHPAARRDESRLLVYSRATGDVQHGVFRDLPELVDALTVVNDTRVVPARIAIEEPRGEVLLVERIDDRVWEALARPTRRLRAGISAKDGGACGSTASRMVPHLCRRTSSSRSRIRSATRRCTRGSTGRPQPRPPAFISPRTCSRGSTWNA